MLFENFSLGIGEGQRVGLIAKNGTGKTTLLNILAGEEDYDSGTITFRRDLKVAYLEQDPKFPAGTTVLEACFLSDSPVIRAIADYERAVQRSGLQNDDDHTLQEAIAQMDRLDAWTYESRVKQILTRLNITAFDQQTENLSGGQTKRIALANALITEPDLLILDEPTNHLDLELTRWLEEYLSRTKLTLLMVTHDRYFLDRVLPRRLSRSTTAKAIRTRATTAITSKSGRSGSTPRKHSAKATETSTARSSIGCAASHRPARRKRVPGSNRFTNWKNGCAKERRNR